MLPYQEAFIDQLEDSSIEKLVADKRPYREKSLLVKTLANTKFSELPEETLEELYYVLKQKDEPRERCPACNYSRLVYYSSFGYKQCSKCGLKIDWKLGENQKPLIKYQR